MMARLLARRRARRGYTLLEMLIVVAVVAAVAALAWPSLRRPLRSSQLLEAAKQVRIALARARLEAIRSSEVRQFQYQAGTGRYAIGPRSEARESGRFGGVPSEGRLVGSLAESGDFSGSGGPGGESPGCRELPEGVRFFDRLLPDAVPAEPDSVDSRSGQSWSAPILFYPNGRTSNARIRLGSQHGEWLDLTLRGLTGSAAIGEVREKVVPVEGAP